MSFFDRCRSLLRKLNFRQARKIIVAVIGFTVVLVGVAMIVLPGPAIVVIPAGLAILATEFVWARRWLNRLREMMPRGKRKSPAEAQPSPENEAAPPDQQKNPNRHW